MSRRKRDRSVCVGVVPIDYAEVFGDALVKFARNARVTLRLDVTAGVAELWVDRGFSPRDFDRWQEIWWGLRMSLDSA